MELQKVDYYPIKDKKQNIFEKVELEINVKKSVAVADDAEKYNYVQRLMANKQKSQQMTLKQM